MKVIKCFFIFMILFISCGNNKDISLYEEDSVKELSNYIKENIEEGSLVNSILFFVDGNQAYIIQSMWVNYQSPAGEDRTLKLAVSEKEKSITDSISAGKSVLAYDSICASRENNLIIQFTDLNPGEGRNLDDYDWKNIATIFNKVKAYSHSISECPVDGNIAYLINFYNEERMDRHYIGFRTVSSPSGIDPNDIYNPDYNFKFSCFDFAPAVDQVYLAGCYPIPIEPKARY